MNNTNQIYKFLYKYYCCNILGISDKCLTKSIKNNLPYNGHFFREIGDRLMIYYSKYQCSKSPKRLTE